MNIQAAIEAVYSQMVNWRRELHRHPELSFQEKWTSQYIYEQLRTMGLDSVEYMCDYSVVAVLYGTKGPGKCIALRADLDALPVKEETGYAFASECEGVSHACGHDGHVAMLLGAAKVLAEHRNEFAGAVKFIFQNGEEVIPGGARGLVAQGVMENPHVDAIFALHLKPSTDCGKFRIRAGSVCIGGDRIDITISGKQGHAASPHLAKDALFAACQYVMSLYEVVNRFIDPLKTEIISVGVLKAGEASNIVSGDAFLSFNARTYDLESRQITKQKIYDIARAVELMTGCQLDISYNDGFEPLINTPELTRFAQDLCTEQFGEGSCEDVPYEFGNDDFSYFINATNTPGVYALLLAGTDTDEVCANHHPKFTWKEEVMKKGAAYFTALAIKYLA